MAVSNGYATLAELKQRIKEQATYTASTISFTSSSKTIADSAYGLRDFAPNDVVEVSGSSDNDGFYNVAEDSGNNSASFVVDESLTDESAGSSVTISKVIDKTNDAVLENAIEAASRHIDNWTNQRFYSSTGETRYYTPDDYEVLFTDNITSVTSLKTDEDGDRTYENTWSTGDYDLMPFNASTDGEPYSWIEINPEGDYTFPRNQPKSVEIVGDWGWSTTPTAIKEATLMLATRLLKREAAPLGVAGISGQGELRQIMVEDPDVTRLIQPYMRIV